jgi:hypothetical protein
MLLDAAVMVVVNLIMHLDHFGHYNCYVNFLPLSALHGLEGR